MNFASDNWAGAHKAISERLVAESGKYWTPYGASTLDEDVERKLSRLFEREVKVFFVATGTAANSLSLAAVKKTGGIIFCHADAHIIHHEGGAVEFMTGGAKLVPVSGDSQGKMSASQLEKTMARYPGDLHIGQKMAISITQATEAGTIYSLDEIRALSAAAKQAGLAIHMDGARFSNAIAALDVSPAEMTWKSGIDILSLGGTKNGCWCAEAIVFFNPEQARDMPHLRKRGANLFSKSTFVSAQFDEWLKDDLWLKLARHSNRMAAQLATAVAASRSARLAWETGSNQLFVVLPDETAAKMTAAGVPLMQWDTPEAMEGRLSADEKIYRFVTSFATRDEDIVQLAALL
ncbi:low specificity L-threonine aldolase [Rhizobium sp. KVB221]|uniref:Low specificity L-threonine aldolase n=1 Tax=Rhizobium setariae TaxID=2801340 RepID=A0A937CQ36_9HYPH|nr:low specificity L-threonine aldolase [Rhizobium setariae]MBL0372502.1 low specificity L-threonine aldolase [Rhizobium setariae]